MMKGAHFILPFLSFLVAAVSVAIDSTYENLYWVRYFGLFAAFLLNILWIYLNRNQLKSMMDRKGVKHRANSGLVILLVGIILTTTAVLSNRSRFNAQFDLTRNRSNTLTVQSLDLIQKFNGNDMKVIIQCYFQDQVLEDQFRSLVNMYKQEGLHLDVIYRDPRLHPDKVIAESINTVNTVIFQMEDRKTKITSFSEEKFTNALLNILKNESKKIFFVMGHGEPGIDEEHGVAFGLAANIIEGQKFSLDTISLVQAKMVPEDADLLVIAGPKHDLKPGEIDSLENYLERGGSLFVATDAVVHLPRLNGLLNKFNINIESDFLVLSPKDIRAQMFGQNFTIIDKFDEVSAATKDLAKGSSGRSTEMMVPFVRSVTVQEKNENFNSVIVAKTSDTMVKITGVESPDDLNQIEDTRLETGSFGVLAISTQISDSDKTQAKDQIKKERLARIAVFGSSHFMNNQGIQLSSANIDLLGGIVSLLTRDFHFISVPSKKLIAGSINLVSKQSQLLLVLISFVYPFLFLAIGVLYWLNRRVH